MLFEVFASPHRIKLFRFLRDVSSLSSFPGTFLREEFLMSFKQVYRKNIQGDGKSHNWIITPNYNCSHTSYS